MNIFLTIDVECYSGNYDQEVYGAGLGLPYILDQCRGFGVKATFFVEALGATRWGDEPLRRICGAILADGHEIGLHVHPVVAVLDGFCDDGDVLWKQARDTQERLLSHGKSILSACGVPEVKCFRAGDFAANEDTLEAMRATGIEIGSNRDLDAKCSTRSLVNDVFPVSNDISAWRGTLDVPLSVFRSRFPFLDGPFRHLEISAVGSGEMEGVLARMREAGYACATILTHPRELFRMKGGRCVRWEKNCRRFERLLATMAEEGEGMLVGQAGSVALPDRSPSWVRPSPASSAFRIVQQGMDRCL